MGHLRWVVATTVIAAASACASPSDGEEAADGSGGLDLTAGVGGSSGGASDGELASTGASTTSGAGPGASDCAAVIEEAENTQTPADIILLVDNSSSMAFEAESVQASLNAFSQQIIDSGVDARIVLLSTYPDGAGYGMCIDPPLGSGLCDDDDNNPPLFTHVDTKVGSNDGLEVLVVEWEQWRDALRPDATLHIVMVSDDDSTKLTGEEFHDMFTALDPSYESYIFHGIVGMQDCDATENVGEVYMQLAEQTGGLVSDLCDQDFAPVFEVLATEVVSGSVLSCSWPIPEPPAGEVFDPDQVNVEIDDGAGQTQVIGRVDDPADCGGVTDGWYYDDPNAPTTILVCPQTCAWMQDVPMARVEVSFGCAAIPAS